MILYLEESIQKPKNFIESLFKMALKKKVRKKLRIPGLNKPRIPVYKLQPNGLYQILVSDKLSNKNKLRFYWNPGLNPLKLPSNEIFDCLAEEEHGGEITFLKTGSNVIFIAYQCPFSVFYSLDKQRIIFRKSHKFVEFVKV
jgi:hypothetical protein